MHSTYTNGRRKKTETMDLLLFLSYYPSKNYYANIIILILVRYVLSLNAIVHIGWSDEK